MIQLVFIPPVRAEKARYSVFPSQVTKFVCLPSSLHPSGSSQPASLSSPLLVLQSLDQIWHTGPSVLQVFSCFPGFRYRQSSLLCSRSRRHVPPNKFNLQLVDFSCFHTPSAAQTAITVNDLSAKPLNLTRNFSNKTKLTYKKFFIKIKKLV